LVVPVLDPLETGERDGDRVSRIEFTKSRDRSANIRWAAGTERDKELDLDRLWPIGSGLCGFHRRGGRHLEIIPRERLCSLRQEARSVL
jgi:hypothetical protein